MYDNQIFEKINKHYNYIKSLGYEIVAIFAQGSMNYNLYIQDDDYKSDVDTKCIVLPTLDDLIKGNKMVSTKYELDGEQIDVKDIRAMMEQWRKQNQSYLELLFSKYYIVNPIYKSFVDNILAMKEELSHLNEPQFIRSIYGMAKEKVFALKKPYPSTVDKIEKYGYDPKQFASIIRLGHLANEFFNKNKSFLESIWYEDENFVTNDSVNARNFVMKAKKGCYSLEFAEDIANKYLLDIKDIKDEIIEKQGKDNFNSEIYEQLEMQVYSLVKFGICRVANKEN